MVKGRVGTTPSFLPFLSDIRVDSRYSWSSLFCRLNLFAFFNWLRPTVRAGFTVRRIDVRLTYPRRSAFIRGLLSAPARSRAMQSSTEPCASSLVVSVTSRLVGPVIWMTTSRQFLGTP